MEGKGLATGVILLSFFTAIAFGNVRKIGLSEFDIVEDNHTTADIPKATPTPECVDTVVCGTEKYVAKCVTCREKYFYCSGPGHRPVKKNCPSGTVFNPDPLYPRCILPANCPYHPPWTAPPTAPAPTTTTATTTAMATTTTTTTTTTTATTTTPAATTTTTPAATTTTTPAATTTTTPAATTTTTPAVTTTTTPAATTTTTPAATTTTTPAATTTTTSAAITTTTPAATTTTTPSATTTTTTTSATTSSECMDSLTCKNKGSYARCVTCQETYFRCESIGGSGILKECDSGKVFNPDPSFPRCILPANCPYPPPSTAPPTTPAHSTTGATTTTVATTTTTATTTTAATTASMATTGTIAVTTTTPAATTTTTPSATTTTTTTSATTSSECMDSFTCKNTGNYAKCVTCQETYFRCESIGGSGILKECDSGKVFNPDPAFLMCILPANCPYHPPLS